MMHGTALMEEAAPQINQLFEPVSLAEQVRSAPLLICAVFFLSLAAA
jgi:hypothetical protein